MTTLAPTLYTRVYTRPTARFRDLSLILIGMLFTAIFAQLKAYLPFTPVPITGQTFAVLLVGATLGSKRGVASMLLYLSLGATGLPLFAGGASGLAYMSGSTLGYLIGFVIAAFIVGRLAEKGLERNWSTSLFPFLIGTLVIYACGAGWLSISLGWEKAFALGIFPFIIGDTIKVLLASFFLPLAWRRLKQA